jgi:S1-C subfamily serine protease
LVVRTIVHSNRPRGAMVVETLYNNQRTKAVFVSADFSIVAPPSNEVPTEGIMGFGSVGELVKMIDLKPTGQPGAAGIAEVPNKPEEPPAAPVAPADGQALSYEQMSGIVLIEGDGGTATGFMTKIRDVDFVVTNLHVLGGNKKISLKTLRGEEVPVLGIFGAAGSDIAIIRIAKGQGELKLAEDVLKTSKIGDKVVVVGNRQGGGVATQTQGSIVGVGPTRIEVNANFEPGNSGSPIVNLTTGEVVGVASYSETRRLEVEETGGSAARAARRSEAPKVEKRWFGYRLDSIAKWEAVDLTKWNAQEGRIETFRDLSEALVAVLRLDFNTARRHPRLSSLITSFEARMQASGGTGINAATEVKDLFRVIRSISDDGVRDLTNGDYYDYFRTSLYWETSIPAQLEYRKSIIEVLKKYEANSAGYLSRMRGGN